MIDRNSYINRRKLQKTKNTLQAFMWYGYFVLFIYFYPILALFCGRILRASNRPPCKMKDAEYQTTQEIYTSLQTKQSCPSGKQVITV